MEVGVSRGNVTTSLESVHCLDKRALTLIYSYFGRSSIWTISLPRQEKNMKGVQVIILSKTWYERIYCVILSPIWFDNYDKGYMDSSKKYVCSLQVSIVCKANSHYIASLHHSQVSGIVSTPQSVAHQLGCFHSCQDSGAQSHLVSQEALMENGKCNNALPYMAHLLHTAKKKHKNEPKIHYAAVVWFYWPYRR